METQVVYSIGDGYEIVKVFGMGTLFYRVFHNNIPKGKFNNRTDAENAIVVFKTMIN